MAKEKLRYGDGCLQVTPLAGGKPIPRDERIRYGTQWEENFPVDRGDRRKLRDYSAGDPTVEAIATEVLKLIGQTDWHQWVVQRMNEEAGTNATAEPDEAPDVDKMNRAGERLDYTRRQAAAANPADVGGHAELSAMVDEADAQYRASREGAANRVREYAEKFGLSYDQARVKLNIPEPKPLTPSTA